jgi:ABC-type branched-subunit amino acid transport system substrate-binding protein
MKYFNGSLKCSFIRGNNKKFLSLMIIALISGFVTLAAGFNNSGICYGYGAGLLNNAGGIDKIDKKIDKVDTADIINTAKKTDNTDNKDPKIKEVKNEPTDIAVVVPTTGRYKYFGKQFLDGIFFSVQNHKKADVKFIVISLPAGAGSGSIKNLFKSIAQKNISAVIGPLFAGQLKYFSEYSSIYRIPVFTPAPLNFSKYRSPYLFHYGMTVKNEVLNDLQYAKTRGITKISAIYPDNAYGRRTIQYVNTIGRKLGIKVVDETAYGSRRVDFFYNFTSLVRFQDMGQGHMTKAEEAQLGVTPYDLMHGITKAKPYIPFDGLFLIGSVGKLKLILTQLAYYNITGIKLFGLSQVDDKAFLDKYGFYMQGIVYPNGFFANSRNKLVKNFVKSYKSYYNEKPNILSAEGYDMGSIIIKSAIMHNGGNVYAQGLNNKIQMNGGINSAEAMNRKSLYRNLLNIKSFKGVCGISYIKDRDFIKRLYLFQLKNNKIYIIKSPF